ncbi:MAG: ABC transporter [Deltaproteobacteria bacterium]|nr:MAG: ABC transporter [Deltaproteobacteria bacterium]
MSFIKIICHELKAVMSNPAITLTVFGGVFLYSFLYPLPYAKQIPREQKVIVVNLDNSQLSRQLEQMVDATPQVKLVRSAYSLEEAKRIFIEEKLAGILVIPENFYRDLMLGKRPTLSYAGDASYFLVYGTVMNGLMGAGGSISAAVRVKKMVASGQPLPLAREQHSPIHLNVRPVFNTGGGYINYVIPAIFILILHHTLIIGAGILGGTQVEASRAGISGYWTEAAPVKLLLARTLIFVGIYWLLCMYYLGFCFELYSVPRNAGFWQLNLLLLPFLLAASQLGIFLGLILPRRELTTMLLLLSSMPIAFGAGFIWPLELIPPPIYAVIQFIPIVPAIKMFLTFNQMGADFVSLRPYINQLWLCMAIYGVLGFITIYLKRRYGTVSPIKTHGRTA